MSVRCPPRPATLAILASWLGLALGACGCESGAVGERGPGGVVVERIDLRERAVLEGEVVERLDTGGYVYLRLSIIHDSAAPWLTPHTQLRWVALDGEPPGLGERVRARSLGRRSRVWEPRLERDFEVLEYVALLR
ncbi:hypothetical protein [Enhygromyxa salina]|uniref:DUF3426 domain-containing protein n=1 Tax=Enhygromyxa salina TaxID=215803 RepID=A0A2S9Y633_9BACT|nr:hypothetical protein [Enhygromyxa salina]PRQ00563.1 hypothetical protein ENSA7_60570 [Enhygromyxa salina]